MKWSEIALFGEVDIGIDALGNPATESRLLCTVPMRLTSWTESETGDGSNAYTITERTFITDKPLEEIRAASSLVVDGDTYSISKIADLGRCRTVRAKVVKKRWESS
ncbi:MAG: hypothetical protein RR547_00520 [Raoultibacter sp.]